MNKIWILTKVFLKNGGDSLLKNKKKNGIPKGLLLILVMGILTMSMGIPFGMFVAEGYDFLQPIGQSGVILGFGLSVVSVAIFVFGIFYVLNTFYFSKDIENLLPLPVKPYAILSAKFITVLVYEYLTEIVLLLPVLIAFGLKSGGNIVYYIYSLIVFLTLPVVPLVIASAVNMVIMRFTNLGKHKDALRIAGGLLAMAFAIGINIFIQQTGGNSSDPQAVLKMLMKGQNSLVGLSSKIFPSANLAAWALIESTTTKGIRSLVIFLFIVAAFIAIFMVMAEILYLKGVVGVSESYSKRKTLSTGDLDKNLIQSSAIRTYTFKELKLLFRTPSYFLNCVLMNFIWPLFLLIPIISQPKLFSEIKKVNLFTQNSQFLAIAVAAGFAVSLFISSSTGITSTAISREGQNLFVGKYIPMRYKSQIMAKVLSGIILNSIGIFVALVVAIELVKPPFYLVALIVVVSLLGIMLIAFTGILIDLNFPKLDWDNEQKAVKQNINLMVNMLIGIAIAVVSVMLTKKFKLNIWEAFGGIAGLSGMADIILYSILVSYGEKLYNKIEN